MALLEYQSFSETSNPTGCYQLHWCIETFMSPVRHLEIKRRCIPVFVAPDTPAAYRTAVIATQFSLSALGEHQM